MQECRLAEQSFGRGNELGHIAQGREGSFVVGSRPEGEGKTRFGKFTSPTEPLVGRGGPDKFTGSRTKEEAEVSSSFADSEAGPLRDFATEESLYEALDLLRNRCAK